MRIILLLILISPGLFAQTTFSREAVRQDLDYLERALKECHPGLYRYQSKSQIDSLLHSTEKQIRENMSLDDCHALLSKVIAGVRCAHTIIVPGSNWMETSIKEVRFFPYQVFFIKGKAYLVMNRTKSREVKPGFELLTINGMAIDSIRQMMFRHISADGYNETLKYRQIHNLMFSYYYYYMIGRPDSFHIQYRDAKGSVREIVSRWENVRDAEQNSLKNPVNREVLRSSRKTSGRKLEINKKTLTATITLRDFFGGGDAGKARQQLHDFMGECMQKINDQHIRNLVVDMRYNIGGYDTQGEELLSWFISEPVSYYRRLHIVTTNSKFLQYSTVSKDELANIEKIVKAEPDGTFTIHENFNSGLRKVQPAPGRFTGNIYFLVNGATGSAAAEFTAVAKGNGLGKFIGEETGGNYEGGNGAEFVHLTLPNTKMKVTIPLIYYHLAVDPPALPGRGTIPDHEVEYELRDLLTGKDTQLEYVYRLIGK
jgi:hypothetical protein